MTNQDLVDIKAMLADLQQGDWTWEGKEQIVWCEDEDGDSRIIARIVEVNERWATDNPDAIGNFIAQAPDIIATLISEIETLRKHQS